jgi:hypothetical protein
VQKPIVPFWRLLPDGTRWRERKERLSRIGSIPSAAARGIQTLILDINVLIYGAWN